MMRNNVFFDTCVYHQPGIDLLAKLVSVDNILFASEMLGAVKGDDPTTGKPYDDTRRYVDALPLSAADKQKIFEGNSRKVFPRLGPKLARIAARKYHDPVWLLILRAPILSSSSPSPRPPLPTSP